MVGEGAVSEIVGEIVFVGVIVVVSLAVIVAVEDGVLYL